MTFPEKEIFTETVDAIKSNATHFTDLGLEVPAHYDWDRSQYEAAGEQKEYPFDRPAIFWRFGEMTYAYRAGYSKRGTIPLTITVVQNKYVDAHDGAENQEDFTKLLEYKYAVNDILQDLAGNCFNKIEMLAMETDHTNRNLHVEVIRYEVRGTLVRQALS